LLIPCPIFEKLEIPFPVPQRSGGKKR